MVVVYHGTSSKFAKDIIENGLGNVDENGKYAEIRNVLSKYINSEILTDNFFKKYNAFIDLKSVSTMWFREIQAKKGNGPFCVFYDKFNKYYAAPEYAKATTNKGAGEFESGIVEFLNSIQGKLEGLEERQGNFKKKKELLTFLKNNAKAQYIRPDGTFDFYTNGNYEQDFPILIKFDVDEDNLALKYPDESRTKTVIKPENIIGIAFLPPFYSQDLENHFDRIVPDLKFLPKDEFLKELAKRNRNRDWCEYFEVKDSNEGYTEYIFSFPKNNIACIQKYLSSGICCSDFYARQGHICKGKIARKIYKDGEPIECEFINSSRVVKKIVFEKGMPVSPTDKIKLNKQELFILKYEKQPQKLAKKARSSLYIKKKNEIKNRLKDCEKISKFSGFNKIAQEIVTSNIKPR